MESRTVTVRVLLFDIPALFAAMDAQRVERELSWRQAATEMWNQSSVLNERRHDHPISASTLSGIADRGDCSCQHALFILRWLALPPEAFLVDAPPGVRAMPLPAAGRDQRLRWDLAALGESLEVRRRDRGVTWKALAAELGGTEHQVKGIRTARYAIGMRLCMRVVLWLEVPAATFIYAASW